jgi:DNA-directed RNA polymerase beta' subunit
MGEIVTELSKEKNRIFNNCLIFLDIYNTIRNNELSYKITNKRIYTIK